MLGASTQQTEILNLELSFERRLYQSKTLSVFRRNPTTWELLLHLAQFEDGAGDGLYNTLDFLQVRYLGSSAMLKFVRERRAEGLLIFRHHTKQSKWAISLSPELRKALFEALEWRNNALKALLAGAEPDNPAKPTAQKCQSRPNLANGPIWSELR